MTKTRHTYHRKQPNQGWSTRLKASTRLKRWAKRRTKKLWRTTKQRIRRTWKQRKTPRANRQRQIKRTAQQFRRHNTTIHARVVHPTPSVTAEAQVKPPDGAIANCRRCNNEVQYNTGRQRWEHTGRGHAECFQLHRTLA